MKFKFNITVSNETIVSSSDVSSPDNFFDAFQLFWTEVIKVNEHYACSSLIFIDMDWMHYISVFLYEGNTKVSCITLPFYTVKKLALDCGLLMRTGKFLIPSEVISLPTDQEALLAYREKLRNGMRNIGIKDAEGLIFLVNKSAEEAWADKKIWNQSIWAGKDIEDVRRSILKLRDKHIARSNAIADQVI